MRSIGDVSSPEALVPPLRTIGNSHAPTGEQRLMFAVLCDAMHAYATEQVRRKRPARLLELRQWFESVDRSYVFAFESVCDALGLEAAYVRRNVLGPAPLLHRPWAHRVHSHRIVAPRVRHRPDTAPTDGARRRTTRPWHLRRSHDHQPDDLTSANEARPPRPHAHVASA
jgi:hypothetical protein